MEPDTQRDKLIEQLEKLNNKIDRQSKIRTILGEGIIRGIGFFNGSAILATNLLGILGPELGDITRVRDTYEAGEEILN